MLDIGPPVGPDAGVKRPFICLSNAETTCPNKWLYSLATKLERVFNEEVAINRPFRGGYIIRNHSGKMPWMQMEFSRTGILSPQQKAEGLFKAFSQWVPEMEELH
jgi:hypothetical protein